MRELITRLAIVDDDAASALRVISYFDTLVDQRASAAALLRAAAALADTGAGFQDTALGMRLRVDEQGMRLPGDGPPPAALTESFDHTTVWLERDGPPGPLDRLILERCARSVYAVLRETRGAHPAVAAIRIACDPDSRPADRAEALRHLGLHGEITVVATPGDTSAVPSPGPIIEGRRIFLLSPGQAAALVPPTVPAGLARSSADDLPAARHRAALALRLAVDPADGGPAHVRFEDLGSLAELAERFDAPTAAAVPDVRLLEALRRERPWVTGLLDALLSHTSLRELARRQNLHHSTLRQRVTWLEHRLGYPVLSPTGYARTATTLTLWRLSTPATPP